MSLVSYTPLAVRDRRSRSPQGFTLVELLIVIAIVIILLALLIPTVGQALSSRKTTQCAGHLKELGLALKMAVDNGDTVTADAWTTALLSYVGNKNDIFRCPEDAVVGATVSYGMNHRAYRFDDEDGGRIVMLDYKKPVAKLVVDTLAEQDEWTEGGDAFAARHVGRLNALLHSGAVKEYEPETIDPRECELWKRYWRPYRERHVNLETCGGTEPPPDDQDPPAGYDEQDQNHNTVFDPLDPNKCAYSEPEILDDDDAEFEWEEYIQVIPTPWGNIEIPYGDWARQTRNTNVPSQNQSFGYEEDRWRASGNGEAGTSAAFTFDIEPGDHNIWLHWLGGASHSSATPIRVYEGEVDPQRLVHEEYVDQKNDSDGERIILNNSFTFWFPLNGGNPITVNDANLIVTVSADTQGTTGNPVLGGSQQVVADAVRIACTTDPAYSPGRCVNDPTGQEIDDGAATATSGWSSGGSANSHGGGHLEKAAGNGDATVSYEFPDQLSGLYRIWLRWDPDPTLASDVPVSVYEGDRLLRTFTFDQTQEYMGADLNGNGEMWFMLGDVEIRNGTIRVVVSDGASGGKVVADGVRIQCGYGGPSPCDQELYGRYCRRNNPEYYENSGMTQATEEAVARGMGWIARHQLPNEGTDDRPSAGWSFDHTQGTGPYADTDGSNCGMRCPGPGNRAPFTVAATGMALLPYFGTAMGPTDGTYGDVISAGINYLLDHFEGQGNAGRVTSGALEWHGHGYFHEGEGYENAIATLAVIEALGVCRQTGFGDYVDEGELTQAATALMRRLIYCQDEHGSGAWRYICGGDDDMSVLVWNLQTLRGAAAAGLDYEAMADYGVMDKVREYLRYRVAEQDSIVVDEYGEYGTNYRYRWAEYYSGGNHFAGFAHALSGAQLQSAGLQQVADFSTGYFGSGSYKTYYVHHFLRQSGGARWTDWDTRMKAFLTESQESDPDSHLYGSWGEGGKITAECGRLWDTVSGTLRLEEYYRHSTGF
ncbi:MAG: prepilin-type N-terminal cleavage/methylation domain-containing protein [Planctomycetota bacterium]|nr:MAG: prepilin-type N-terminal cleavage/methylation domain-containing protein [Planctomycetota bacterium]REJ95914.1 MAG: prepilin-type N-terminal cleavage/methylation domain-containing protein [Planctomycetota bacterium]REK18092.1 MAG: prepilin-type N-terminal cleavage/methylation domain-containing protein [Planctomycetota bacterium]REK37969.1 MAG: prepilin-type N-terminal cleavage/methylation domain-containing protein [Planctomycetota bacterium]